MSEEIESDRPKSPEGKSTLVSRNVTVGGRRTSVRLEPAMWDALYEISRIERLSIHALCSEVASRKDADTSLTSAIRIFLMAYFKAAATEEGHLRAGHGLGRPFRQTPFARGDEALGAPPQITSRHRKKKDRRSDSAAARSAAHSPV